MSRKLYPGEARKVRAMLDKDFTDVEISRALHVAQSTISNMRNEGQNDVVETESEPPHESEELTEEEETDLKIYEMVHSGYSDSEIAQEVGVSEDIVRNHREPETINFVGGKKHNPVEIEKEEFENSCAECGHEFDGDPSHCPRCGIEFENEGDPEKDDSIGFGGLAIGGGLLLGALLLDGLLKKRNQSWV